MLSVMREENGVVILMALKQKHYFSTQIKAFPAVYS